MDACRDCKVCGRLGIVKLILLPFQLLYKYTLSWNIGWVVGLFVRYCPECGHRMSQHQRRADGSFKD